MRILVLRARLRQSGKAKQGGIMSIEASVDELYGDTKDDEWKQEEIARLKAEQVYLIWKSRHLICRQMTSQLMALITVSQVLITSEVTYGT